MRKLILTFFVLAFIGAGSVNAQVVWGIRAGVGYPSVSISGDGGRETISGKLGVEIGPTAYFSLSDKLYLNAAAMFSLKSFDAYGSSTSLYYAEVPVYLGYRIPLGKVETYLQAGPYFGIKLAESNSYDGGSGFTSFDAGLALMYGININRFKIELGLKYGLTNLIDGGEAYGLKAHMTTPFLGISYVF